MRHALLHRLVVHRLLAISIIAAGLAPATALAQAPKAAAPRAGAAQAAKPATAPKAAAPAAAARAEPAPFSLAFDRTITLHADLTAVSVTTTRIRILGEAALRSVGQQTVPYIEGMQTLDIVEAYTEKADGRRVAVDPAGIITRDEASGLNAVYQRDAKVRIVIFPDIAVGDTTVLTTRLESKAEVFPGYYFYNAVFAPQAHYTDCTIRLVVPKGLAINVAVLGGGIEDRVAEDGDVVRHLITYHAAPHAAEEPGATAALDYAPRLLVSTFKDYEELGRAYWAETEKHVAVTPEIQALADEITAGIGDKRAQAVAIDRWIKSNVRYVAVYLGSARVVPNDANTVLRNKYGDCKDHAALMTALLAAKGIASEQVLINGTNAHALDQPATLAALNHVIVYLPEWGIYDDPTASLAGFGVLANTYDKPALHVSANGVRLARTPVMRPQDHTLTTLTKVVIAANGTVSGETRQSATGIFAAFARAVATAIQANGPETTAERQLQAFGTPGKGRYEIDSPRNFAEPYVVKGRFTLNDRFGAPPAGRKVIPIGIPILSRPGELLLGTRHQGRKLPFTCLAGRQVEEIEVTLPEDKPLNLAVPGRKIVNKLFSYKSDYRLEDRTLKIRHEFVSLTPNQVCAPEVEAEIGRPLMEVSTSVNSRLALSPHAAAPPTAKKPPETGFGALFRRN
jgi:transglutaminase-like putative cysteine protease